MTAIASLSSSLRSLAEGQRCPVTCSFRFSPVPTPRKKRPGIISVTVAAAWATIAGWILISGHVTAVPIWISLVAPAIAPKTDQTNGLLPCRDVHRCKWSEIVANEKPDSSAAHARRTRSFGLCSSEESEPDLRYATPLLSLCLPGYSGARRPRTRAAKTQHRSPSRLG